jgi:hypothetical protein
MDTVRLSKQLQAKQRVAIHCYKRIVLSLLANDWLPTRCVCSFVVEQQSRRVPSSLEYIKAVFPALLPASSFSSPLHELHPHQQIFKQL